MKWLTSCFAWIFLVACGATFLLPKAPHYQNWMPYGYELGGMALVMLYLSLGFASLGLYGLVSGWLSGKVVLQKSRKTLKIGMIALGVAAGLVWCYLTLMNLTLDLKRLTHVAQSITFHSSK